MQELPDALSTFPKGSGHKTIIIPPLGENFHDRIPHDKMPHLPHDWEVGHTTDRCIYNIPVLEMNVCALFSATAVDVDIHEVTKLLGGTTCDVLVQSSDWHQSHIGF